LDPATLAALSGVVGATKVGVDVVARTYALLQQVKGDQEDAVVVDEHLLRLALLAVDRNLVVLDGINTRVSREHRAGLALVADALEIAPLAALLVRWPQPGDEPDLPRNPDPAEVAQWNAELEQRADHEQLLAQARYLVARTSGLSALAGIDSAVRRAIRVGLRLRNLRDAHIRLRRLLHSDAALSHLVKRRRPRDPTSTPPASPGTSAKA